MNNQVNKKDMLDERDENIPQAQEPTAPPLHGNPSVEELSDSMSTMAVEKKEIADDEVTFEVEEDDEEPTPPRSEEKETTRVPVKKEYKTSEKRREQLRTAQATYRRKQRAELLASRRNMPLPPRRGKPGPIPHSLCANLPAIKARKLEIEQDLGLGRLSKKMLLRREAHRASRCRVIANLRAKIMAETARQAEMEATKTLEQEWLELHAQVDASRNVRRDQEDGGLPACKSASESDDDWGEALPSVPTKPVDPVSQSLTARLATL